MRAVGRGEELRPVEDRVGPGEEAQRLGLVGHRLAAGGEAHVARGHGDAGGGDGADEVDRVDGFGGGERWGNLEKFQLVVDGREVNPVDRNVRGVTFVDDDTFYATVAAGGSTWLVEGDLTDRTLTSVSRDAESPSLSPDGTRVAFKVDVDPGHPVV